MCLVNLPPSIASQPQVAATPPIDVKPAPGAVMRPKPRPPLADTAGGQSAAATGIAEQQLTRLALERDLSRSILIARKNA